MSFPAPTPRQAKVIWFAVTMLAWALTLAIIGALLWGLGRVIGVLGPVLIPVALAGVIAFILDPVVEWLTRQKVPRLRAILLVFIAAGVLVLGVIGSVIPRAVVEARDLATRIPTYIEVAQQRVADFINHPPQPLLRLFPSAWQEELQRRHLGRETNAITGHVSDGHAEAAANPATLSARPGETNAAATAATPSPTGPNSSAPWWLKAVDPTSLRTAGDWLAAIAPEIGNWLMGQVGKVASWFGVLAGLALIPIYAFYFLLEKSSIERRWTDYLPVSDSRFKDELIWLLKNINDSLIVFFRGQVLVAISDGILYSLGFLIIGLPYALLLGMMAMVLTIVPFLGAIVTCVTALVIAIVQFGDWQQPLLVGVVFVVVQGIEGWIIQPKIIGDRVGLHPVTIIISLLVGTTLLGGIIGGLVAIPATAVIRALMFRYVWRADRGARKGEGEGGKTDEGLTAGI